MGSKYANGKICKLIFTTLMVTIYLCKAVSGRRLTCVFVVIGGMLVCTAPQLIPITGYNPLQRATHHHLGYHNHNPPNALQLDKAKPEDSKPWYEHAFWVLVYASGHVAVVFMTIAMEKLLSFRERVSAKFVTVKFIFVLNNNRLIITQATFPLEFIFISLTVRLINA